MCCDVVCEHHGVVTLESRVFVERVWRRYPDSMMIALIVFDKHFVVFSLSQLYIPLILH